MLCKRLNGRFLHQRIVCHSLVLCSLSGLTSFCSRTHLGATHVAVNLGSLAHAVISRLMNVKMTPVKMGLNAM